MDADDGWHIRPNAMRFTPTAANARIATVERETKETNASSARGGDAAFFGQSGKRPREWRSELAFVRSCAILNGT